MRAKIAVVLLLCFAFVTPLAAQQQAAQGTAEQTQSETISPAAYTGEWTLPQGPLRLEWNLEAAQYEFYVYEGETVRIGSRGTLEVEGRNLTFTAEEITEDGESWEPVRIEGDGEASRTFHATVEEQSLLLASPDFTQFYVQYYRPDAVPAGTGEGLNGVQANGAAGGE